MAGNNPGNNPLDDRERNKRKEKEKEDLDNARMLSAMVSGFLLVMKSYRDVDDEVLRYSLLADKFSMGLLMSSAMLPKLVQKYEGMEGFDVESLQRDARELATILQKSAKDLMDWIQQSIYGPDTQAGRRMMKGAEKDFDEKK